jgi:Trk-type K+ transport system membrane component
MNTIIALYAGFFLVAGSLAFFTGFALLQAIKAARWHDQKQFWRFLLLTVPLVIATVGVFWLGAQQAHVKFIGNVGFGPDWQCTLSGPAASEVCLRKVHRESEPAISAPRSDSGEIPN